ncbi:MAG TPA: DMT family transporter [Novosphingobium sp.]|nr:DMT family transporter [Novosphingobium sp.]
MTAPCLTPDRPSLLPAPDWGALLPYAALAGSVLSVCLGTSFAKQLFPLIGAPATVAYRVGFSALVLMLVFRPWRLSLRRAEGLAVLRYGAAIGLMNFCFYMALRSIPLGLALAIEFLGPLSVSLIHARRPAHFAAVGLAVAGLSLLLPRPQGGPALDPVGVGFALAAAVFWGSYILFGKRTGQLPAGAAVALGMGTAACLVVPVGVATAGAAMFSLPLAAMGLVAAVLSSAVPYSLEMVALKRLPARHFGVLMSVEPAVGALAGALLLGEHLAGLQWLAVGLVVAASAVSVLAAGKAH